IKASATLPAYAEKLLNLATTTAHTNRPITLDGAESKMSFTTRVDVASQLRWSHSANYTPALTPSGVPTYVPSSTRTKEPKIALAKPPVSLGGGVISENSAKLRPPRPNVMVSHRIQTSQNTPKAMALRDRVKATWLMRLRAAYRARRCASSCAASD